PIPIPAGAVKKLKQHPLVLAFLLLLLAGAAFFAQLLYQQLIDSSLRLQAGEFAAQYAGKQRIAADKYLADIQRQLTELSEKTVFAEAVISANPGQLAEAEQLMREWAPELSGGLLLAPGDQRLLAQHHFAGQLLAENVLAGEQVAPAAARIDGQWQLLFCHSLKDREGATVGAMLAILPMHKLTALLTAAVDPALGRTELAQTMPHSKAKTFLMLGDNSRALDVVSLKLKAPNWQLHYTGGASLLDRAQPSYSLFIIFLGVLVTATLLLSYLAVRLTLHFHREKVIKPRRTKASTNEHATDPVHGRAESFLEVIPPKSAPPNEPAAARGEAAPIATDIPAVVFRDYDIRGIADQQLSSDFATRLGRALAARALALGENSLIVARDGRLSSDALCAALQQGILNSGCNIIDLGLVPTPLLSFATHQLQQSDCGVMVTASHNPGEYNGFKIFFQHHALCGDEIKSLREEMLADLPEQPPGQRSEQDLSAEYIQAVAGDIVPAQGLKVILDAGNGAAGELAVRLLEATGCDVLPLYCDVDGNFPNHAPDPSVPANLDDLVLCVRENQADLGIALDGDGDRIVAVAASGKIVWPDELLMIFARDVVSRHPGADVVFDIKSTRRLNSLISSYGGRPVMWKTGHSHMYNKIMESKAPLGGEYSGHIFFHDRWHGFDDGLYAAARLIEIISIREQGLDEIMAGFETRVATPEIRIPVSEETKFSIVEQLLAMAVFREGNVSTIDGLRVDFPKAWGLVRASNTSPALTLRFEAESHDALEKIQSLFRQQLRSIDSNLTF
ncbi:phosphomannomutase/phosphoglucomutase, partial [Porticoccus sp.]